jgi:hypothetical protein
MLKKIPVEQYTRTVGYFAPISQTNPGKKSEIRERHLHNPKAINYENKKKEK